MLSFSDVRAAKSETLINVPENRKKLRYRRSVFINVVYGPVYMEEVLPNNRGGLPSSIVFPGSVYMRGRVTLGGG